MSTVVAVFQATTMNSLSVSPGSILSSQPPPPPPGPPPADNEPSSEVKVSLYIAFSLYYLFIVQNY